MLNTDKATPELFSAMAKAQGEIENAAKSSTNPHFRSKYADLAEVLNTIRPILSKHGLSLIQSTGFDGSMVSVTSLLAHESGGYVTSMASCVPAKSDAQGIGSATTYLRRYSAAAVAGIAQEDDDGQSAVHDKKPEPVQRGNPMDGVMDHFGPEEQAFLQRIAAEIESRIGEPADAVDYVKSQSLETDEKIAVWSLLKSSTRSALKKAGV